jgi:hypothetical protein
MSTEVHVTPGATPGGPHHRGLLGWIVLDPTGRPYAWCGSALAGDASAAIAVVEPDAEVRQRMLSAGWSARAGFGTELVGSGCDLAKASA